MKQTIAILLTLCLSGCSTKGELTPEAASVAPSPYWFNIGYNEGLSGSNVKENTTLAEWYGEAEINRPSYLQGYAQGQTELCQTDKIIELAKAGKEYPQGCNSVSNSEQLKSSWQQIVEK